MTLKTFAIAAAATFALASAATADGFTYNKGIEGNTVQLGQVTSPADGLVSLYTFHAGEQGALLGTEEVSAGANYDVRVTLGQPPVLDVVAVLTVDGQVIDTQELDTVR